jgi:alkylation response protein AidB-like acyl-CoA dehydrogenase
MDRALSIIALAVLLLVGVVLYLQMRQVRIGNVALLPQMRKFICTQEAIVTNFSGLAGDIADIKSTLSDLAARVEAAFAAATDAAADQDQVDAAKAQLDDVLAEMRAIGAPPATEPTDTPPATP